MGQRFWSRRHRLAAGLRGGMVAGSVLATFAATLPSALAQEAGKAAPIKLELNKIEPAGENCRTYFVVDNSAGSALKSLKVDLFAFDSEGIAQKRLGVEFGPVGDKKTMVRLFDFPGIACPKISRILLNDVLACEGGEASRETCLERIETSTKTPAAFAR